MLLESQDTLKIVPRGKMPARLIGHQVEIVDRCLATQRSRVS
jgi:hypothetical protein